MTKTGPLKDIRVLDFTHVLSGPFGTSLLGDLGADVIKVEPLGGDGVRKMGPPFQGGESAYFFSVNRNKRGICVDLKTKEGVEIIRRLIPSFDVIVENFRPDVMERLGLGYEDVKKLNPDIIYSSMTAFGREGPYRNKPGFELIIQALTGLVDVTTPPGGLPAKIQIQVVDLCTGMFLAYATLAALYHKQSTGEGQRVDTSLLESTIAMMANLAGIYFMSGEVPTGLQSRNPQAFPSQAFKTADGYFVMVGHWDRFSRALGKPEWATDAELSSNAFRVANYAKMTAMVETITKTKTTAEWLTILEEHQVAAGPINTVEEAFVDPGVEATGIVKAVEHPTAGRIQVLDKPWHMSASPGEFRRPAPTVGQHTHEVLSEFGFTGDEIKSYLEGGIISDSQSE